MPAVQVPVIDLSPYFGGSAEGKAAVARAIDQACRSTGFLVVTGHGIAPELIAQVSQLSAEFFALPLEEKRRCNRPSPDQVRGYSAVAEESLSYSLEEAAPGDLKESLSVGPIDPPDDAYHRGPAAGPHFAPNIWPARPAALQAAYSRYFGAMSDLARSLMRMFALALAMPETFFDDKIDKHISMFRVLSYPAQKEAPLPGQLRASAHSDYGSLTIVLPDGPGLQVNIGGEWIDVPHLPGAFAVNLGDLMMQWTNDQWLSTLHRVVNPPLDDLQRNVRRQSLVFFHQPNYDAQIACLPACLAPGEQPKHAPISSGDHLTSKFVKQTTFGGTVAA